MANVSARLLGGAVIAYDDINGTRFLLIGAGAAVSVAEETVALWALRAPGLYEADYGSGFGAVEAFEGDVALPSVSSTSPANAATGVAVDAPIVVTFSEPMAPGGLDRRNVQLLRSVAVSAATNASPIAVTTATHGYTTGDIVTIAGVGGNTAANGTWTIVVTSTTAFTLTGSTGNSAYTSGGRSLKAVTQADTSPVISQSGLTATMTPASPLTAATLYAVSVAGIGDTAGRTPVVDLFGNSLLSTYLHAAGFTTAS